MRRHPRGGAWTRARINLGEPSQAEYWSKTLGVSKERLVEIIDRVGDQVDAVRREVRDQQRAEDSSKDR